MAVIFLFIVLVIITGASALIKGAVWAGLAGLVGPLLCLFAGGGVRGSFLVGTRDQKIGGLIAGAVCFAVGMAMLYATGFSVRLFALELTGIEWGAVGAGVGLLFTTRSLALPSSAGAKG